MNKSATKKINLNPLLEIHFEVIVMNTNFHHVGIVVKDLRSAISKYCDAFQIDSNEIGKMEQDNSILVTISGSDIPVQIIGSPGDWSGIIERRFVFEQDGTGTITYTGSKSLPVTFQITSTTNPSGGTDTITTYVAVNGVLTGLSGTTETNNSGFVGIMGVLSTVLDTGDIISFWTENNNDSSNITVEFTKVSIFSI